MALDKNESTLLLREKKKAISSKSTIRRKSSALVNFKGGVKLTKNISKNNTKKSVSQVKVEDVVSFTYASEQQVGIVRYIGETAFSTGKWCGVQLAEPKGKHNGTVKGHTYFCCEEKCGVFVPLQKVELVAYIEEEGEEAEDSGHFTEDEEEEDENMRIVVKSLKSPTTNVSKLKTDRNDIAPERSSPKGEDLSGSNDSGIMSPSRGHERPRMPTPAEKKGTVKGATQKLVVSSFVAPSPTKVIVKKNEIKEKILNGEHILGPKSTIVTTAKSKQKVAKQNGEPILGDHVDYSVKPPELLKQQLNIKDNDNKDKTEKEKDSSAITTNANSNPVLQKNILTKEQVSSIPQKHVKPTPPTTISDNDVFLDEPKVLSSTTSPETPEGSKIPRRVSAATIHVGQQKKDSDPPPAIPLPRRIKKTSNDTTTTKTTHLPIKLRSVSAKTRSNSIEEKTSVFESKTKVAVPRMKKISTTSIRTKKPSIEGRQTKISTGGSQNDEPVVVMGNANAVSSRSSLRKNSLGTDNNANHNDDVSDIYSQRDIKGAVVIDRKQTEENKTKLKYAHSNSTTNHKDSKLQKDSVKSHKENKLVKSSSKDLQKEIDDYKNQLNERTSRIDELETQLKNSRNTEAEKLTEYTETKSKLELELSANKTSIKNLEEKLLRTNLSLNTSNVGLQALSIVIQRYLVQVENATAKLQEEQSERIKLANTSSELSLEKENLTTQLADVNKKLDSSRCQCDELQKELTASRLDLAEQVTYLKGQSETEKNALRTTLVEQKNAEVKHAEEEHTTTIERLKSDHQGELAQLKLLNEQQYQEVLNDKTITINQLTEQHEQQIKDLRGEHEQALKKLNDTFNEEKRLMKDELASLNADKIVVDEKLKEVMRELESDTKVQAAVAQYKHLPAELESLNHVLDMRNQELKELRVKCMELEKKRDEYYELEGKYSTLSQQNQSLNELLKKKTQIERRVSVERDTLMERLERESRQVSRLSMEKEQLLFRASNPDLSFHSLNEEAEELDSPPSPLNRTIPLSSTPQPKKLKKAKNRHSMNF